MSNDGVEKQLNLLDRNDEGRKTAGSTVEPTADVTVTPPQTAQSPKEQPQQAQNEMGGSFLEERERLSAEVARLRTQFSEMRERHDEAVEKLDAYGAALSKLRKHSLVGVKEFVRILDETT